MNEHDDLERFEQVYAYVYIYIYMCVMVANRPLYHMFLLHSYRCVACVSHESRKVPGREAASNPNEHLVT